MWKQRTLQTPSASPSPTSPTTKSCVGPGPKGSKEGPLKGPFKGPKEGAFKGAKTHLKGPSKRKEKERTERTSEKGKFELSDVATATKTTPEDDCELPDAWN
eukprot:Skav233855  [mRNA]  locus=scaffold2112:3980:4285:- [translate_table: standard]